MRFQLANLVRTGDLQESESLAEPLNWPRAGSRDWLFRWANHGSRVGGVNRGLRGSMKQRINYGKVAPGVYDAMDALDRYLHQCGVEKLLLLLVQLRASQINGCAYCLDMHWK